VVKEALIKMNHNQMRLLMLPVPDEKSDGSEDSSHQAFTELLLLPVIESIMKGADNNT